ncbi:hypothetical protein ABZ208_37570 [Streptomyces sp. NPDC006208]|uniref:hypothetical protein n=1 Tax=Streptomyces sp. NPDC006208 TaxID=3156734 RepID=UPI0033B7C9B9
MSDEIFDPEIHAADKDGNPSLNKNGTFRKKRRDAGAGRGTSSRTTKTAGTSQHRRYEEGVQGLLQIPAMALSFVNPVDGFCVAHHTPPISKAVADLAIERPEVAAALDKVLSVGPYGALLGATLPLVIQLMHNHGMVPESMAKAMGATPKKDIERHLKLVPQTETTPQYDDIPEMSEELHDVAA